MQHPSMGHKHAQSLFPAMEGTHIPLWTQDCWQLSPLFGSRASLPVRVSPCCLCAQLARKHDRSDAEGALQRAGAADPDANHFPGGGGGTPVDSALDVSAPSFQPDGEVSLSTLACMLHVFMTLLMGATSATREAHRQKALPRGNMQIACRLRPGFLLSCGSKNTYRSGGDLLYR